MICAQCAEEMPQGEFCPSCGKAPYLEGKYRLESIVGHGAHGTTYRAARIGDGAVVAIKELLVRKVESVKAIDLFQREVRVLGELDHPGVPNFIEELDVDAGRSVALYLVQEFVDGRTIEAEFAARRGSEREVFELAAELLDTLAYLHERRPSVIHRDIKPGNIMRRESDGSLVLIDFGSVRDAIDTAEGGSTVAGTFGYMAPEQFMGRAIPATDIYGVGATIVALLSRKDPQELVGENRRIEWKRKLGLAPEFATILESMLREAPEKRASDAALVARQIRAALRGELELPRSAAMQLMPKRSSELATVPPAPRELPAKFRKEFVAQSSFNMMFGGIFFAVGVFSALVPVAVAMGTGTWMPLFMALLFGGIFGGIGAFTGAQGYKTLQHARSAYQYGVPAGAIITDIGSSSYQVNRRSATVYSYEFIADGAVQSGEFHSWDSLDLSTGSSVTVLYLPDAPSQNILFDPRAYDIRKRVRQRLMAAEHGRDVTGVKLEFDEVGVEEPDVEESQVW